MSWRGNEGVDVTLGEVSNQIFGEILVSSIVSKGFCVIETNVSDEVRSQALTQVAELKSDGKFDQPPELVADGLLGIEGSNIIHELPLRSNEEISPDQDVGLDAVEAMIVAISEVLKENVNSLGFQMSHRTAPIVHESGMPGDSPDLKEKDVMHWLEHFVRHKIMGIFFLGPMEGMLRLKVHDVLMNDVETHEVVTRPGTVVFLRPDLMSHDHVALGKAVAMSQFFLDGSAFNKCHATGGWVLCPAARNLDQWAMNRVHEIKATQKEDAEWDQEIPTSFRKAMNLWYSTGSMVAVHGLACKVPRTTDINAWYMSLVTGPDLVTTVPVNRWDHSAYYDSDPDCWKHGYTFSNHCAYFEGIDLFDNKIFGLSMAESKSMDPNQRLIMEVGYEALIKMGNTKNKLLNTLGSVYVGHQFGDWAFAQKCDDCNGVGPTGQAGCIAANRLSFLLGMKGPSITIDTDSSSSLSAAYLTAESVQHKGRGAAADFGVGLGCATMLTPIWWAQHCGLGWLSVRGRCLTFDKDASGWVRGEGVLGASMRSCQELVDGQLVDRDEKKAPIGVIAGACMSQNGRAASMTSPSMIAVQEVIAQTVRNASISPEDVDFVEGHLPADLLRDVIEVNGVMRAHRGCVDSITPLPIGSVKSNTGNLMESGGIASLIKALMSMQWGAMHSNIHLRQLNPHMDLEQGDVDGATPVILGTESVGHPRKHTLSSVLSQGYGGSNVCMIPWGRMDEDKVRSMPTFEFNHQYITYWPGGGGSLEVEAIPRTGYFLIGTWNEGSEPDFMERESDNSFGYTLTLGANRWEQFQIIIDKDLKRCLHPGFSGAPRETAVLGPDMHPEGTWMLDARTDMYALLPEETAADEQSSPSAEGGTIEASASGGSKVTRIAPVETLDMGKPGDKYRIHLHVRGKWRTVDWEKIEDSVPGVPLPDSCIGRYFICASWNAWTFDEMNPVPEAKGTFRREVKILGKTGGSFQIARNRDQRQMFYPIDGDGSGETVGPDEWGDGLNWVIPGKQGDLYQIELTRDMGTQGSDSYDVKAVSFTFLRNEPLTPDEITLSCRPMFTIVGTWTRQKELMTWDGTKGYYKFRVTVGSTAVESFQILQDGIAAKTLFPSVPDANPSVEHELYGPQPGGYSYFWTIGGAKTRDQALIALPGSVFEVRLYYSMGYPTAVDWVVADS